MGSLATLPTFAAGTPYTHTDFNAAFAALTIAAGAVGPNELAANAVTLAKLQQIAQYQLITRTTAGSGNPELITASANALALLQAADYAAMRTLMAVAPLESPPLTGVPTAPTAAASTNTTQLATTAFVRQELAALVDSSPGALDTLNELAAALGDDPNFAATVTAALAGKLAAASNLSDLANAATARTNLGLFGSNLESSNTANILAGSAGADLVYTGASVCKLDLTAGTWIVWGSAAMRTNDAAGQFWLGMRNVTDGADFGQSASMQNESLGIIHQLNCFGFITIASGTKEIRLKGFRSGSISLEIGVTTGVSGALRAVRLTT